MKRAAILGAVAMLVGCSEGSTLTGPLCSQYQAQDDTWITVECNREETTVEVIDSGTVAPPVPMGWVGQPCGDGTALNAEGFCTEYTIGIGCGWGTKCPQLICRESFCLAERCMNFFAADGLSCAADTGTCQDGSCQVEPPGPVH